MSCNIVAGKYDRKKVVLSMGNRSPGLCKLLIVSGEEVRCSYTDISLTRRPSFFRLSSILLVKGAPKLIRA
ncbi:hypothetical protein DYBT9275_01943 [Dyadobacter sp. CECT 9275]|uniref:Uncharacterized protein n=1 Tax=Dyadobacter helix TaxID=2822344 RepID=A0A916JD38_9BACT|nr:hypothetical protein DYBT9275_01943 [Dyadobacter sp. CECT 9275]